MRQRAGHNKGNQSSPTKIKPHDMGALTMTQRAFSGIKENIGMYQRYSDLCSEVKVYDKDGNLLRTEAPKSNKETLRLLRKTNSLILGQ